jgi:hypothetical protein
MRHAMKRARTCAAIACAAWLAALPVRAEPVTVGLFAPSAPFPSTVARVELARRLGGELGAALGAAGSGRVYARAADFAAAVRRGEVAIALVDPAYLAGTTGYTVLAVALHDGEPVRAWQLVARGAAKLGELRGRRALVPTIGGRETDLVLHALLGGELGRDFFGRIEAAPDTASALAALALGKAEAAVVPATGLPQETSVVVALPALSNPAMTRSTGSSPPATTSCARWPAGSARRSSAARSRCPRCASRPAS